MALSTLVVIEMLNALNRSEDSGCLRFGDGQRVARLAVNELRRPTAYPEKNILVLSMKTFILSSADS